MATNNNKIHFHVFDVSLRGNIIQIQWQCCENEANMMCGCRRGIVCCWLDWIVTPNCACVGFHNISSLKLKIDKQLSINMRLIEGMLLHCNNSQHKNLFIMKMFIIHCRAFNFFFFSLGTHIHVCFMVGMEKLFMVIKFINFGGEKFGSWKFLCLYFHDGILQMKKFGII